MVFDDPTGRSKTGFVILFGGRLLAQEGIEGFVGTLVLETKTVVLDTEFRTTRNGPHRNRRSDAAAKLDLNVAQERHHQPPESAG